MTPKGSNQSRLDLAERRLCGVDDRFSGIDRRFNGIDERLDGIEDLLRRHQNNHHGVRTKVKSGISIGVVLATLGAICELIKFYVLGGG